MITQIFYKLFKWYKNNFIIIIIVEMITNIFVSSKVFKKLNEKKLRGKT